MCMGIGATPGTKLKGKVCMKQYRAIQRGLAKKKEEQAGPKTRCQEDKQQEWSQ